MKTSKLYSLVISLVLGFVFILSSVPAVGKDMTAKDLVKEAKKTVKSISVAQAKKKMSKKGVIVLDVRVLKKFKSGHIPGAIHIPRGLVEFKIGKKIKNKKAAILIYCKKGGRACLAGLNLTRMGYKNITNIDGGWKAWVKAGYAVE